MPRKLLLPIIILIITNTYGQDSIIGDWKLSSYKMFNKKEVFIKNNYDKDEISFSSDGHYIRNYFVPELPKGAYHQVIFDTTNGTIKKEYYDENGYELKMVQVINEIESGIFLLDENNDSIIYFSHDMILYDKSYYLKDHDLIMTDTLNGIEIQKIYCREKKRRIKRGSS